MSHSDYSWMACYEAAATPLLSHDDSRGDRIQDGCASDFPAMVPLDTDAAALRTKIGALTYSHIEGPRTYSASGIAWATRMLDPAWRTLWRGDTHPVNPNDRAYLEVHKVLVLLTDGQDKIAYSDAQATLVLGKSLSSLQASACTAAKAAGIDIYVIGAIPESKISQSQRDAFVDCSSATGSSDSSDYVFLGTVTETEIEDTFASIATRLTSLRRTH